MKRVVPRLLHRIWLLGFAILLLACLPKPAVPQLPTLIYSWVELRPSHPDTPQEKQLETLFNQARHALAESDYLESIRLLHEGYAQVEKRNPAREYEFAAGIAFCDAILGDYDDALKYARLAEQPNMHAQKPLLAAGLGWIYLLRGDFVEAMYQFGQVHMDEDSRSRAVIANSLLGVGNFLCDLGKFPEAQKCYQDALELGSRELKLDALVGLGFCSVYRHDYQNALDYLLGARALLMDDSERAFADLGEGVLYWFRAFRKESPQSPRDDYEKARQAFQRAVDESIKSEDERYEGFAHGGLALALCGLGRNDEAQAEIDRGMKLYTNPTARDLVLGYGIQGLIARERGDYEHALGFWQKMITQLETTQAGLDNAIIAAALHDIVPNPYLNLALLLVKMKRPEEALLTIERGRGRGLGKQAAQNLSQQLFTEEEKQQWQQARRALMAADLHLSGLQDLLSEQKKMPSEELKQHYQLAVAQKEQAERDWQRLTDTLYRKHEEFARLSGAMGGSIEELYKLAHSQRDTLFLEYGIVDRNTTVLLALRDGVGIKAYLLPVGSAELQRRIYGWRQAILAVRPPDVVETDRQQTVREKLAQEEPKDARALYQILLQQLESDGLLNKAARLLFVTSSALNDAPLSALRDASGRRLIDRFSVWQSLSLRMLLWSSGPRHPERASIFCVADSLGPDKKHYQDPLLFNKLQEKLSPKQPAASSDAFSGNDLTRGVPGALEGARTEGKVEEERGAKVLYGPRAYKEVVMREIPHYAVLLFAIHGIADPNDGLLSHLLLSPRHVDDNDCDTLTTQEIMRLPLTAQLTILSACESAQGETIGDEGLLGLVWAFRAAGCPSVVGSLWQVDDLATQRLISDFTGNLRAPRRRKDDALRTAILALKAKKEYAAPYYWAAFQLYGDAGPVPIWQQPARQ